MALPLYLSPSLLFLIAVLVLWSIVWKGLALWRSSRLNQPVWFVLLLVINTLGILEIIYLFFVAKAPRLAPKPVERRMPPAPAKKLSKTSKKRR